MAGARILVVEDEALIASEMSRALAEAGLEVVGPVASRSEALDLAHDRCPALALVDIGLDGKDDGVVLAEDLQTKFGIPVVFVSGTRDEATISRAKSVGPYGYLVKPLGLGEIVSTVEMALIRARTESQLRRSQRHALRTLRSIGHAVVATDLTGRITFINREAEELLQIVSGHAMGRPASDFVALVGADDEPLDLLFAATDAPWDPVSHGLARVRRADGAEVVVAPESTTIVDEHGGACGLVVVIREPLASESGTSADPKLEPESVRARLSSILEGIGDPLVAVGADWRISYLNEGAARRLKAGRDELIGQILWSRLGQQSVGALRGILGEAMDGREPRSVEVQVGGRWTELATYPSADGGLLILLRDISSRKAAQSEADRAAKLESLGVLARGFAHEFNNLLTIVLGHLGLAAERVDSAAPSAEILPDLETARRAARDAQGRVGQLLTFARGGEPVREEVKPSSFFGDFLDSWSRRRGIGYRLDLATSLPGFEADHNQFRVLLSNFIRNAEQAMPEGGEVIISARVATGDELPFDPASPAPSDADMSNRYLLLEVRDTGDGVSPEVRARAFDPYFTTRESHNASGLGLAACRSIAHAHGGAVDLLNGLGGGGLARAFFPLGGGSRGNKLRRPRPGARNGSEPSSSPKRILVMEDEHLIRQLIRANLGSRGYDVTEAEEGGEAIRQYREALDGGMPFDLVILDLSVPNGMGGKQTIEELRKVDPEVVAIVSSGYSDDPVMSRFREHGFCAVLPKPYEPDRLASLVEEVIGG